MVETYELRGGIYVPPAPVVHREQEYGSQGFAMLRTMQHRHFWYLGRHRFLLHTVHRFAARAAGTASGYRVVDLGGGCGGWLAFFARRTHLSIAELALADSSLTALHSASLPSDLTRYQVDLLTLDWVDRWEQVFLLDVLEHIPEEQQALQEIYKALAPGGLLFITAPALRSFWTWNDEVVGHQRRYSRTDFRRLAGACGYRLLDTRYFMFFLSPLLLASRLARRPRLDALSQDELWSLVERMHKIPSPVVNALLEFVFRCETPLGHYLPFPWGTSILAVLQKPIRQE